MHCFSHASFFYLVIHNILFHYIHAFIWIPCAPLIILDHLFISRVKFSSFLYHLSIMKKRRRNCGNMWFLFKGRNTCLCQGELCFILLGRVLTSFFLYTGLVTIFTYIVLIFDIYIYIWEVCLLHLHLHVLFLFYFYTHASYYLYAIYYFCFTLRCRDEFYLKYFRNTSCQSLLAINSFLAKNFKSLC